MAHFNHGEVWWSVAAVCPFFRRVHQRVNWPEIVCEGVTSGITSTALRFPNAAEFESHLELHCCDLYGCASCPLYSVLNNKYAEDGSLKEAR